MEFNLYLLVTAAFLLGIIATLTLRKPFSRVLRAFVAKVLILKRYWIFVLCFVVFTSLTYWSVLAFAPDSHRDMAINIAGQCLALIFAIFVGYFAFLQVVESRLDKLKEKALQAFKNKTYSRALQYYTEANAIDPRDHSILSNLCEVMLLLKKYSEFHDRVRLLEKVCIESQEKLSLFYLRALEHLIKKRLGEAEEEISLAVNYIKANPKSLSLFSWDFSDLQQADVYSQMTGDPRKMLDNFIKYLNMQLDDSDRQRFESGNYTLVSNV